MQKPSATGSPKSKTSSGEELNDVVTTRFRKEMTMLFSWLPEDNQCKILLAVSKKTRCSVPSVLELLLSLTEMKSHVNVSCFVKGKNKLMVCSSANKTFIGDVFNDKLLDVFASLPASFKCHVVNTIALAYNPHGRRHLSPSLSVSQALSTVENIFPSLILPQTCADMEMDHLIPSIPPVNITVDMAGVARESWLKTLTQKGPDVYETVLKYEWETTPKGKMLGLSSTAEYLAEKQEEINSARLFIVGTDHSDKAFSVLFRLKVKRKQSHRLREMRSTYKIVQALGSKTQKELRTIFNATIIAVSLSGQKSNITKTPSKTNTWTLNQVSEAKLLFPAHLSEYYKQLGKAARCFIVLHISFQIKKSPKEAEMFYVSFNRLSRKHTCYYTWRKGPTGKPPIIIHERFSERATQAPIVNNTEIPTNASSSGSRRISSTNAVNYISAKVHKEDFSSLEIVLFALLGLLCFTVLAFTVNCVVMALKANAKFQKNCPTKTALQTAVFHKGGNVTCGCGKDCVHFTERKKGDCHPAVMGANTRNKQICNCSQLISLSASCKADDRWKERTWQSQSRAPSQSSSGENRTNSRTHVENVYCVDYSPKTRTFKSLPAAERDSAVKDSPKSETSSSKSEYSSTRRELDIHRLKNNDRVLESQGKAISYCSISDTSCRGQPPIVTQSGCLPSEQSHETVVVLLNCGGLKEVQV